MADDFVCELHGSECPNEKDAEYPWTPVYRVEGEWKIIDRRATIAELEDLTKSTCPIIKLFSMMALLRRSPRHPTPDFEPFSVALREHRWYILNKASKRVLISILDTLADDPRTQAAGTAAVVFLQTELLASYTSQCMEPIESGEGWTIHPDTTVNFIGRLRSILFWQPLLWLIFYKIFHHYTINWSSPKPGREHLFKQHERRNAVNIQDEEFMWPTGGDSPRANSLTKSALGLLLPSIVSSQRYEAYGVLTGLFSGGTPPKLDKDYGEGTGFPARDGDFLRQCGAHKIMDFGCGRGCRPTSDFEWTTYAPRDVENRSLPYSSFDGVVSYDVLEHLPSDELSVIAAWLELYAEKCIVLGISTSDVAGWSTRVGDLLPQFDLVECRPSYLHKEDRPNYVVFHLVRAAVK